jgi:EmrB/QacA subfamily drug resistance transporter
LTRRVSRYVRSSWSHRDPVRLLTRPAEPAPRADREDAPDPQRWKALAVCLVAGFMTLLDVSIVNVALPSMEQGLDAQPNALQWIVSGYALTLGLLLVPSGRLGDARGRRTVFMTGIALFVVASAACGFAQSPLMLIVSRLVQGCAGGLITPQVSGFIQTLFRGEERGKAFGFFGTMVGISTAIGPLLGGALIALFGDEHGWRAVFFVNLPVGAAALVLARRYLPAPDPEPGARTELDPIGVVLLGLAVVCVLVPFIEQRTWHGPLRLALFPIAASLLALWVWHERRYGRDHEPVVSLDLFRIRSYVLGAGLGLLYFAGFTGTFFIFTQYLQLGLHYPAWKAGLSSVPFALGTAIMASIGSRQVLRRGRALIAFGLGTVIVGLALVWVVVGLEPGQDVGLYTALPLLVAGLGGGLVISPNQTLTLSQVPVRRAGSAGGVLQTGQRIGSAAGIAVTGSVFYGQLSGSAADFPDAFRHGLVVIAAFVAAALALAVADAATRTKG